MNLPEDALGKELILDIHNCNVKRFSRESLEAFFKLLCCVIDMERTELFFWEYSDEDPIKTEHLAGLSAVQFIKTSNITVHTFDNSGKICINLFSCKDFDTVVAKEFIENYFEGKIFEGEYSLAAGYGVYRY